MDCHPWMGLGETAGLSVWKKVRHVRLQQQVLQGDLAANLTSVPALRKPSSGVRPMQRFGKASSHCWASIHSPVKQCLWIRQSTGISSFSILSVLRGIPRMGNDNKGGGGCRCELTAAAARTLAGASGGRTCCSKRALPWMNSRGLFLQVRPPGCFSTAIMASLL